MLILSKWIRVLLLCYYSVLWWQFFEPFPSPKKPRISSFFSHKENTSSEINENQFYLPGEDICSCHTA
ncbi:hypothetical protein HanRHA438_Chr14g0631531 [Helianthus annuus]|nr:hypothetical protein HanRHA438_Chr14g0631531 [Helianthus annuus]